MKNGITQSERMIQELEPHYVVPDERTLLELVQFTLSYAKSVSYFDFHNKPLGNWKPFLLNDPIFITGMIASTSLESYKIRQDDLASKAENNPKGNKKFREGMADNLLSMIKNIYKWEDLFMDCNYAGPLLNEIINSRRFLEPIIKSTLQFQHKHKASDFQHIKADESGKDTHINIAEAFKVSYKNLVFIVDQAHRSFDDLMDMASGKHQPHIGLLLSALKLFVEIQKDLNELTGKHLDFYYRRILNQVVPLPGRISMLVGLVPKPGKLLLEENSGFTLVFPSKKTIPFQNQFQTELSQAKISSLKSLYISNDFPFSTGYKVDRLALNWIYEAELYQGEARHDIAFHGNSKMDFPALLGENQNLKGLNRRTMKTSKLGFIVSSPALLLENGEVHIEISFELNESSFKKFRNLVAELLGEKKKASGDKLTEIHTNEYRDFAHLLLNDAFFVDISGIKGWQRLNFLAVNFFDTQNKIVFKLEPEGSSEMPVPFDSEIHEGSLDTEWPCIRFMLNSYAHYPPYRLLKVLEIIEIEILTQSKDVNAGFECSNQIGKLDTGNPFLPFGSNPTKDSYFNLKNPLILNKYLSSLSLRLDWIGLPEEASGFKELYKVYPGTIDNNSFKGMLSLKSKAHQSKQAGHAVAQEVQLFETIQKAGEVYLKNYRELKINLDLVDINILKDPVNHSVELEENPFLSLKLSEPSPFAFGHKHYTQLYADVSFYNSRFPKRQKALPRAPYTPQLEKIVCSYSNQTKENLIRKGSENGGSIKVFHLYPFGQQCVYPNPGLTATYLLPQLEGNGNLIVGLSELKENQVVNLGFKLYPAYFIHTITHPPKIKWEYMEKNQWLPLGNLLMEDSTFGMLQSGIVKFKLPEVLELNNTRLPKNQFWIRISYSGNHDINSRLISIFTNATWISQMHDNAGSAVDFEELRGNLQVLADGNLPLNEVIGPYHMNAPSLPKSQKQDNIRISETLRHRGRGISTWDMERLVLERFPQIGRVMVYGRSDFAQHLVKNSNIQVVVIPNAPLDDTFKSEGFRAPFELLQEIKFFLRKSVSPFTRLEVCNPVFEKLKVRGHVKFKNIQQSGYYRDILEKEIIAYLSPNPMDFQKGKGFVSAIYKAEIQNFIESRSYVDFVTGFSVIQIVEVQGNYKIIDTANPDFQIEMLRTVSPYAILTSADSHQLEINNESMMTDPKLSSIGDLSIEADFIVKKT